MTDNRWGHETAIMLFYLKTIVALGGDLDRVYPSCEITSNKLLLMYSKRSHKSFDIIISK